MGKEPETKGHFTRKPCPLARCKAAVGGNPYAGELLYQLNYRFARKEALQFRHGKSWCAQTGKNWQAELCLTVEQYKTALRVLKTLGFVECRHEKFSEHQLYKITWLRLTDAGSSVIKPSELLAWMAPTAGVEHAGAQAAMTPSVGVNDATTGNSNPGKTSGKKKGKSLAKGQIDFEPTSEQGKKNVIVTKKDVETAWLAAHEKHRPHLSVSKFVGIEWKQAADIIVRLGADAAAVIDIVVERWEDFTTEVAGQEKYFKHPERPALGYLAHFGNVAKDFWKNPPPKEPSWNFKKLDQDGSASSSGWDVKKLNDGNEN